VVDNEDAAERTVAGRSDLVRVDGRAVPAGEDNLGGRERFFGCCHRNSLRDLAVDQWEP
jgi:hypothetical protein